MLIECWPRHERRCSLDHWRRSIPLNNDIVSLVKSTASVKKFEVFSSRQKLSHQICLRFFKFELSSFLQIITPVNSITSYLWNHAWIWIIRLFFGRESEFQMRFREKGKETQWQASDNNMPEWPGAKQRRTKKTGVISARGTYVCTVYRVHNHKQELFFTSHVQTSHITGFPWDLSN